MQLVYHSGTISRGFISPIDVPATEVGNTRMLTGITVSTKVFRNGQKPGKSFGGKNPEKPDQV
ncbi:MAG: hypothetical protein ACLFM1_10480 [Bacteroidales bacterium]